MWSLNSTRAARAAQLPVWERPPGACEEVWKSGQRAMGQQLAESSSKKCVPEVQGHPEEPPARSLICRHWAGTDMSRIEGRCLLGLFCLRVAEGVGSYEGSFKESSLQEVMSVAAEKKSSLFLSLLPFFLTFFWRYAYSKVHKCFLA